jgi:hypothetical protein
MLHKDYYRKGSVENISQVVGLKGRTDLRQTASRKVTLTLTRIRIESSSGVGSCSTELSRVSSCSRELSESAVHGDWE